MSWCALISAVVAEVEVDRGTGVIRVRKFIVVHDCGQIINPDGVQNQIEGNVIQTVSRTLIEEVKFDRSPVTSLDWETYPILTFPQVPEIVIELIDRPTEKPWGAGEPSAAVVPSAISNAVFDATGVRLRSVPYTPDKVKAAMRRPEAKTRTGAPPLPGRSAHSRPLDLENRCQSSRRLCVGFATVMLACGISGASTALGLTVP